MLNPSENLWSYTKSFIKRELAENREILLNGDRDRLSICEFRARELSRLGEEALTTVTAEMCSNFIGRFQSVLTLALREDDMQF